MTRLAAALLLSLAALPAQATTCLLHVDGVTQYDGPCRFMPHGGDGSFEIAGADGWLLAELTLLEPGVGEGWWNENSGSVASDSPLGVLHRDIRDPACWVNGFATLCAW